MTKFLTLFLALFLTLPAQAAQPFDGETFFRVTDVLQGDAGTFTNRTGKSSGYFHLAGCETYAPQDRYGADARDFLAREANGKLVEMVFAKNSGSEAPSGHYLVTLRVDGLDVCKSLIQKGLALYRSEDASGLSSPVASGYESQERSAKFKRVGLWSVTDRATTGAYVERPRARFDLHAYRYNQIYVNGTYPEPAKTGFDRPEKEAPKKDPNDWRTKTYK